MKNSDDKSCNICKEKIRKTDNYCQLTDYKKGKFFQEAFYHTICYIQQIKHQNPEQQKMRQMAIEMMGRANKMMDRVDA